MTDSIQALYCDHLKSILHNVQLSQFSRLPMDRLSRTAVPNIHRIELITGPDFLQNYSQLFEAMFHAAERERTDLIVQRLDDEFAGKRAHLAPFRAVGLVDSHNQAIGAAQFSILRLSPRRKENRGVVLMVPYLQYIYIRPANRRQDMSELLHTLVLALTQVEAVKLEGGGGGGGGVGRVPFTFFETEPPDHGVDEVARAFAAQRARIHERGGSRALMFRDSANGKIVSAHVQPGLEVHEGPITLVWALRPAPVVEKVEGGEEDRGDRNRNHGGNGEVEGDHDVDTLGDELIAAYYQSLRDEGFPEKNIALAEEIMKGRRSGRKFVLMPLAAVTHEMYNDIDVAKEDS